MLEDERTPAFRKRRAKSGRGETHAELSRHPRTARPEAGKDAREGEEQESGSEGADSPAKGGDRAKGENGATEGD